MRPNRLLVEGSTPDREVSALAMVLCTSAYSAAQGGDRDQAKSLIARRLALLGMLPVLGGIRRMRSALRSSYMR